MMKREFDYSSYIQVRPEPDTELPTERVFDYSNIPSLDEATSGNVIGYMTEVKYKKDGLYATIILIELDPQMPNIAPSMDRVL